MKLFHKKRSYKREIRLFSIFFCLPIMVIAFSIKLYFNGPIKNDYIERHNESVLREVNYISEQIGQIEVTASNLGQQLIKEFQLNPIESISDFKSIQSVAQQLFFFTNSTPLIKESMVLILNKDEPFVIGEGGTYPINDLEVFSDYQITNKRMFQWVVNQKNETVFLQSIPELTGKGEVLLATVINKKNILNLLEVTAADEGSVALSVDGQLIISKGKMFNDESIRELTERKGFWQERKGDVTYNFVSKKINRLSQDWYFYSAIPIDIIVKKMIYFSNLLFILGMLLFLTSIIMSHFFVKKTYQPVHDLMINLFGEGQQVLGNEFEFVMDQWRTIDNRRKELEHQKSHNELKMKQVILNDIIEGKYAYLSENDLRRLLKNSHWEEPIEQYRLYYICLSSYLNSKSQAVANASDLFILENLVLDISKFVFKESAIFEYHENGLLLFVPNSKKEMEIEFFEQLTKYVNRVIDRYIVLMASQSEMDLIDLPQVMQEVIALNKYQQLAQMNQWLSLDNAQTKSNYLYPENLEKRIIGAYERNERDIVLQEIIRFVENIFRQTNQKGMILEAISQLYEGIEKSIKKYHLVDSSYMTKQVLIKKIEKKVSPRSIAQLFYEDFVEPTLIIIREQIHLNSEEIVYQTIEKIKQNHCDPNLSLEMMADAVGVEASYLSREFKRISNMNFIDYLTDFRMEVSKEALAMSTMQINEIAEKVGYNSSYFNRLFKKKFGMTPGQYRKHYQAKTD